MLTPSNRIEGWGLEAPPISRAGGGASAGGMHGDLGSRFECCAPGGGRQAPVRVVRDCCPQSGAGTPSVGRRTMHELWPAPTEAKARFRSLELTATLSVDGVAFRGIMERSVEEHRRRYGPTRRSSADPLARGGALHRLPAHRD